MKRLLIGLLCMLSVSVYGREVSYKRSDGVIELVLSKEYNHISLGGSSLSECVGDINRYKLMRINSNYFEFIPQGEGSFNLTFVSESGLLQDVRITVRDIRPQRIRIEMADETKVFNSDIEEIRKRSYINYMKMSGNERGSWKREGILKKKQIESYIFKNYRGEKFMLKNMGKKEIRVRDFLGEYVLYESDRELLGMGEEARILVLRLEER